jgi:REP element-mobilizing transposase RayT
MKRVYEYRRHLRHYQDDYNAIFLTFSTHHRWILPSAARTVAMESCRWGNGSHYDLHGAVVMPDHIHLIFTPLYDGDSLHSVAETMQGIKGASAHKINHLWSALDKLGSSANRLIESSDARRALTRKLST